MNPSSHTLMNGDGGKVNLLLRAGRQLGLLPAHGVRGGAQPQVRNAARR